MNQKGNLLLLILGVFLLIAILPAILMWLLPQSKLLFQIMMIFILYMTVRGYLGSGVLSIIVSAVLIYFLVFKYIEFTAGVFVIYTLLTLMAGSMIIWGLSVFARK